ncbi:MAG TPA: DNA primase small subunit domain-containing protein [Nitrososphaerales archaeon]
MNEKTSATLRQIFKEYYFNHLNEIETPTRMDEREFGYMTFEGLMVRHFSFKKPEELRLLILKETPHSVYYSTSFYTDPSLPMHAKDWKGSDLVFDIDADMLSSPCRVQHDKWICRGCGFQKNGIRTVKCPKCKGLRIHEINIACNLCLFAAKKEAIKLLDILVDDFGIKRDEIYVYFSGSMGYHITVSNSIFEKSDQFARSEIVDYVSGKGLIPKSLGVSDNSTYDELMDKLPSETDFGWRGRIARHFKVVKESYEEGSEDAKKTMIELYVQKKYKKFTRDVQKAAKTSGANVDPSVTTDIHRIFRLPGTLNGKTGLLKKKCKDIDTFDPLIDAVVIDKKLIKVEVDLSPKFTLLGEEFGPFNSEKIELPAMAAVYLMGLGMAEVQG